MKTENISKFEAKERIKELEKLQEEKHNPYRTENIKKLKEKLK